MDSDGAVQDRAGRDEGRGSDVVLGLGELEATTAAGDWALEEAGRRGARLRVVHALPPAVPVGNSEIGWYAVDQDSARRAAALDHLEGFAAKLRAGRPDVEVVTRLVEDRPRAVLRAESRRASVVVTGSRRHGGWHEAFRLGSTSLFVSAHAVCPVVVVHEPVPGDHRGVVVGHDGSGAADEALQFAARRAQDLGEPLTVVRTWTSAIMPLDSWSSATWQQARDGEAAAQQRDLEELAQRVRADRPGCELDVRLVREERPADALLSAAATARLLVVGTRGHGAFLSALLGSTSHAILHRAHVPVVVVPDAARVAQAGGGEVGGRHVGGTG